MNIQSIVSFLPIVLVLVVFYFLMVLPEKKRKKEFSEMINSLSVNDEIMTRGGVIGKIISLDDDSMVLESGPNKTRIRFARNSIGHKIAKEDKKEKIS